MAEINKKLVKYATEAKFEEHLAGVADKINPKSVVFIENTGRIWTHGKYYDGAWAGISGKPSTFTPSAHSHGSITNDGKIGTLTNRIIETTTGGSLTHVAKNTAYNKAFGTGSGTVAQGNDSRINNGQSAFTRTTNAGITGAYLSNITELDTPPVGARFISSTPSTHSSYPAGMSYPMGIEVGRSAAVSAQLVIGHSNSGTNGNMAFRSKSGASMAPWRSVWDNVNLTKLTQLTNDLPNFTRTVAGLVPSPTTNTTTRYLREDGTWVIPPDTHWTTGIRAGASGTNANSVANDPFIKVLDNTTYRSQIQILGGTNITAKSDATGKITIDGTHNHTLKLIAGLSTATVNSTVDVADPYIRLFSDNTHQGNIQIVGGTNVGVVSKNGTITLTATDTTYSAGNYMTMADGNKITGNYGLLTKALLDGGTNATYRVTTAAQMHAWIEGKNFSTESFVNNAIDELEIGGRNLLAGLEREYYKKNDTSTVANLLYKSFNFKRNSEYVISYDIKGSGDSDFVVSGFAYPISTIASDGQTGANAGGLVIFQPISEWRRVWVKIKTGNWDEAVYSKPINIRALGNSEIYIKDIMFVEGTIPTDWTPAPEDQVSDWLTTDVASFSYIKNKPSTLSGYGIKTSDTLFDNKYHPKFTPNNAFNKNFGTAAGTVAEGNHNHNSVYEPLDNSIVKTRFPRGMDADTINQNGVYGYANNDNNTPAGRYSTLLHFQDYYKVQLAVNHNASGVYIRGGTSGEWKTIYHSGNLRSNSENDSRYLRIGDSVSQSINGVKTFTENLTAKGYIRTGSSNNHVLLGGGSHKAVSDFVDRTSDQTIGGQKIFSGIIGLPRYGGGLSSFRAGTGDGGTLTTHNSILKLHYGLGISDHLDNVKIAINSRQGEIIASTFKGYLDGNAKTVTNGVYTTGDQTIGGVKSFTGNVGIGTTAPSHKLTVMGSGYFLGDTSVPNAPTALGFYLGKSLTDENRRMEIVSPAGGVSYIDFTEPGVDYLGRLAYYISDNSFRFYTNRSEKLRIINNGNVGIGTTSPSEKLEVSGNIKATSFLGKATSAGNADTANGQKFNWSNSSNSPTYLWGANANGTAFLASRANMSVKYADSAGSSTTAGSTSTLTSSGTLSGTSEITDFTHDGVRVYDSGASANGIITYAAVLNVAAGSNHRQFQIMSGKNYTSLYWRTTSGGTSWKNLNTILDSGNSSVSGNTITINGTSTTWANTHRGIQNNLTSTSTADSLSAAQGRLLANGSARDSTKLALTGGTLSGSLIINGGATSLSLIRTASSNVNVLFRAVGGEVYVGKGKESDFVVGGGADLGSSSNQWMKVNSSGVTAPTFVGSLSGNASSATKVNNKLILKFDTGTAENTSLYTYDGSAAKTIDIKAGSNVSLTKAANTITISSTNTNTTYSAGTLALLQAGENTSNRVWSSKILKDWYLEEIDILLDSDRFKGSTFSSNVIDLTNVYGAFNVNSANNYTTYTLSSKKVRGAWAKVLVNASMPITISGVKLINLGSNFEANTNMYLNVMYDGVDTLGYYTKMAITATPSYYINASSNLIIFTNTPISNFCNSETSILIDGVGISKGVIKGIHLSGEYSITTNIGNSFLYNCGALTSVDLSSMTNVTSIGSGFLHNCAALTSVDLSSMTNVTSIGAGFLYNSGIKTFKMGAIVPPSLGGSLPATFTSILVPFAAVNAYKSATYWSQRASIISGY